MHAPRLTELGDVGGIAAMRSNLKVFETRFREARDAIRSHVPRAVRRGAFLDIGCGTGNGVVAALASGARCAVGIDIDLGLFAHDIDFDEFPDICRKFGADPRRAVLIEGDLLSLRFRPATFDYCLMFDSAEHLPQPHRFIERAYDLLAEGGCFVIDASPLYYSATGHHMFDLFDGVQDPWPHLMPGFEQRARALGANDWLMSCYRTLNRVTADELYDACRRAGFTVLKENRQAESAELAALLDRHIGSFDPTIKVERRWLFEQSIQIVAQKGER
jgi:SAM-dependent methyltransferase